MGDSVPAKKGTPVLVAVRRSYSTVHGQGGSHESMSYHLAIVEKADRNGIVKDAHDAAHAMTYHHNRYPRIEKTYVLSSVPRSDVEKVAREHGAFESLEDAREALTPYVQR